MAYTIRLASRLYQSLLRSFLPADDGALTPEAVISLTNLLHVSLLSLLLMPTFIAWYAAIGMWQLALPLMLAAVPICGAPLVYRGSGSLFLARELFILSLFAFKFWEALVFGGMVSPGSLWFIACPLIAILLGSVCSAIAWLAITAATLAGVQLALGNNVVFLTPATDNPHAVYLVNLMGLSMSIAAFLALVEHARRQGFRRLEAANRTISDLAMRDALTGIYNRRYIIDEISRAGTMAAGASFCICLLDLDRFKSINDNFGHAAGDHVLQSVAACIQEELRQQDCFGRYGGEEFLLLLKNTDLAGGGHFLERIRQRVESLPMTHLPEPGCVTISAGIAAYRSGEPFAQTIARADLALYAAKNAGRNCVMLEPAL